MVGKTISGFGESAAPKLHKKCSSLRLYIIVNMVTVEGIPQKIGCTQRVNKGTAVGQKADFLIQGRKPPEISFFLYCGCQALLPVVKAVLLKENAVFRCRSRVKPSWRFGGKTSKVLTLLFLVLTYFHLPVS